MATLTTLVSFDGADGDSVQGTLIADSAGDLFGTTAGGGAANGGTVFEVTRTATGYATTPTTLASFSGADETGPTAGLVMDASGDLFGVAPNGGTNGDGYVFEIAYTQAGYAALTVLVNFDASAGTRSKSGLVLDGNGDLFGTTLTGGADGDGSVYEIADTGGSYASTATTLVSFDGPTGDSSDPDASLILDASGDLFGTTEGNNADRGTVFEVAKTANGYAATPTTLVRFGTGSPTDTPNGAYPEAPLVMDAAGDLFGTTSYGAYAAAGSVFEVSKAGGTYASTPTVLTTFNGSEEDVPVAGLVIDADGDLFGTSSNGGTIPTGFRAGYGYGTAFELADTPSG